MPQAAIEPVDHLRRRPFLRAEHRAGALRAGQRVGDVAGNVNPAICQPRIEFAEIDERQRLQRAAPGGDLLALGGQQFCPQRLRHPGAAVIGRTAANTNNDLSYPGVQRMADKLPVPQEVVSSGLRCAGGTLSRPLAAAISIKAHWRSPDSP